MFAVERDAQVKGVRMQMTVKVAYKGPIVSRYCRPR